MHNEKVGTAAQAMSNMVNTFNTREVTEQFIEIMNRDHRTLQQSFTKLCLAWIENVASDNYRTDGRNEASHFVCKEMLKLFREAKAKEGFTDISLDIMSKPSRYCHMV